MKKQWVGSLLILLLTLCFTGCGASSEESGQDADAAQRSTSLEPSTPPAMAEAMVEGEKLQLDNDAYFRKTNEFLADGNFQRQLRKVVQLEVFYREGLARGISVSDEMAMEEIELRKSGVYFAADEEAATAYQEDLAAYLERYGLSEEDYWDSIAGDVKKYLTANTLISMVTEEYEGDDPEGYIEGEFTDELFQKYGVAY